MLQFAEQIPIIKLVLKNRQNFINVMTKRKIINEIEQHFLYWMKWIATRCVVPGQQDKFFGKKLLYFLVINHHSYSKCRQNLIKSLANLQIGTHLEQDVPYETV